MVTIFTKSLDFPLDRKICIQFTVLSPLLTFSVNSNQKQVKNNPKQNKLLSRYIQYICFVKDAAV